MLVFNPREYGSIGDQSWNLLPTRFPIFQVRAKDLIDLCRDRLGEDAIDSGVEAELGKRFQLCADDATSANSSPAVDSVTSGAGWAVLRSAQARSFSSTTLVRRLARRICDTTSA